MIPPPSAKEVLEPGGLVHVTLAGEQARLWRLDDAVDRLGLEEVSDLDLVSGRARRMAWCSVSQLLNGPLE
jgi:hypothetical protein